MRQEEACDSVNENASEKFAVSFVSSAVFFDLWSSSIPSPIKAPQRQVELSLNLPIRRPPVVPYND